MKKLISIKWAALVLAFLLVGCSSTEMGFNPKVGDSYKVETDADIDLKMSLMGQNLNMLSSQSCDYILKAENKDKDGNIELSLKYDKLKISMNAMGQSVTMDSDSTDENDANSKSFKSIIGQGFNFKVDKDGKITEVTGIEELISKIAESGSTDANLQEQIKSNIGNYISDQSFESSNQQLFNFYPKDKKELKVGDTWQVEETINKPFNVTIKYNCEVKNITSDLIEVSIKSEDKSQISTTMNVNGQDLSANLYVKVDGTVFYNKKTGIIKTLNSKTDFDGSFKVKVSEKEIEIPCVMTMNSKCSVTKQ